MENKPFTHALLLKIDGGLVALYMRGVYIPTFEQSFCIVRVSLDNSFNAIEGKLGLGGSLVKATITSSPESSAFSNEKKDMLEAFDLENRQLEYYSLSKKVRATLNEIADGIIEEGGNVDIFLQYSNDEDDGNMVLAFHTDSKNKITNLS